MEELETLPEGVSPEQETPDQEPPEQETPDQETPQSVPPVSTEELMGNPEAGPRDSSGAPEPSVSEPSVSELDEAGGKTAGATPEPSVSMEELLASNEPVPEDAPPPVSLEDSQLKAVLEAIVYVAEEPLTLAQISTALQQPVERIRTLLDQLVAEFDRPEHGVTVREVAGGYKMATKAEHHEAVRSFVKSLKPPLKLSLPALETLAVIAYKQPVTSPEIMEIRGVRGAGVLNTLLDRKLIAAAGRKNVIGKPILYKTTKEFLIQFGLKDLSELPSLKEFEEIRRMAFADSEVADGDRPAAQAASDPAVPEKALPGEEAGDRAASGQVAGDRAVGDQAAPGQAAAGRAAGDNAAPEQAVPEQGTPGQGTGAEPSAAPEPEPDAQGQEN